ncbi:MAG TPA: hypothetical protein DDW68_14160 [Verrucomicrobiales bacterium]|nr:hypothetical protein [Verrucomicrobiales bacterium]|tara:strand:- start:21 stop:278 length:258 start_codon:yes stop_codon:yes gene_type:complete
MKILFALPRSYMGAVLVDGKGSFFLEIWRIHSSMACQRGEIELFRGAPLFGADEAFATLAGRVAPGVWSFPNSLMRESMAAARFG